jgi:hypothetical protein
MSTPQSDISPRSQDFLEAERGRDDVIGSARADELLARVRATVDTRAKGRAPRGVTRLASRRFLLLAAAALLLIGGAALAAYRASSAPQVTAPASTNQAPSVGTHATGTSESAAPPVASPAARGDGVGIPATSVEDLPAVPSTVPRAATAFASGGGAPATNRPTAETEAGAQETSDEAELIARARASLDAGATDAALRALYLHERQFQHPKLSEQREILFVQTFAAAHRMTEARQRFVRFKKAYPDSPSIPALARLVESDESPAVHP